MGTATGWKCTKISVVYALKLKLNLKNRERKSNMEDARSTGEKVVDVSVMDRESEALETELCNLANLLDSLAGRLAPVLLSSPQEEKEKPGVSQAMSPLCSRISAWRARIANACRCVNKLLGELEI